MRNIQEMSKLPKFKVGDRIKPIDNCLGEPRIIIKVYNSGYANNGHYYNGYYITNQGILDFEYEDNWDLDKRRINSNERPK
jgi:hypothetical protein